jgi:hypothetical protein
VSGWIYWVVAVVGAVGCVLESELLDKKTNADWKVIGPALMFIIIYLNYYSRH